MATLVAHLFLNDAEFVAKLREKLALAGQEGGEVGMITEETTVATPPRRLTVEDFEGDEKIWRAMCDALSPATATVTSLLFAIVRAGRPGPQGIANFVKTLGLERAQRGKAKVAISRLLELVEADEVGS